MQKKRLYTIGYEGADLSTFLATLEHCGIRQIIDIRDVPISRKKGFSKSALTQALADNGIAYVHLKGLGDPKAGREAARRGDFLAFNKIFRAHLKGEAAQVALKAAVTAAASLRSCLLCYERSHVHCHRTIVAAAIADQAEFQVLHVGVQEKLRGEAPNVRDRGRATAIG